MPSLSSARIEHLLEPFFEGLPIPKSLGPQLSLYLDLLLKWNARTNLTSIRAPETIVTRHFGESLFLARHLPAQTRTVLDLGSGAGFPGIPVHLLRPDLNVTLAESQQKKAAFLHEVVRELSLTTQIYYGRAEDLIPQFSFNVVTLRAVDNMALALEIASQLGAKRLVLTSRGEVEGPTQGTEIAIPASSERVLLSLS